MSAIFLTSDMNNLLRNKKVVFMGDSNVRTYYKDMLCLHNRSEIIPQRNLKEKMENSVFGDRLMSQGERTNGRHFREERQLKEHAYDFSFYFLTRVYNAYVEDILQNIVARRPPDVLLINSCLWDLARWGPKGVEEYKDNVITLAKRLKELLPKKCLVVWLTSPPLASQPYGGFLLVELEFLKYCLRFHVMEANTYASKVFKSYGFDVLDIHYHFRMQIQRRAKDGIHWLPCAVRYITNLILTHASLAWGEQLPHRFESVVLERVLHNSNHAAVTAESNKENTESKAENSIVPETKKSPVKNKPKLKSVATYCKEKKLADAHKRIRAWR